MIMEFRKGRTIYFVLLIVFVLVAVKLFIPLSIGGFELAKIAPFVPIKNKFLKLLAIALTVLVGQGIGAVMASSLGNKEFKRLASILLLRCESAEFIKSFAPAFAARSYNIQTALAKGLLMTQGYFAAGEYDKAIAAAEKTLELPMAHADVAMYLSRSTICEYLIFACCESGDTGKAARMFKELEEAVSHTAGDTGKNKDKSKQAKRILTFTRNYITFTVNKKYDSTAAAEAELALARNNYERIMISFLLGRLYLRAGSNDDAWHSFHYVENHHSDFACRELARAALAQLTPPADADIGAE